MSENDYIDNYLLAELVAFEDQQTLAKAAQQLHITQPTVTRGLQKLEDQLGVKLFDHQPNRLILTPTGKYAADLAHQVLKQNQSLIHKVTAFDSTQHKIKIASVAPGPLIVFNAHKSAFEKTVEVADTLLSVKDVATNLLDHQYSIILTNQEIQTKQIESLFVGKETLSVHLDQFMYQANQQTIRFADLAGLSFVVIGDIGPWRKIIQKDIPHARFMYQAERDAFAEITKYSNFPYFTTNITQLSSSERSILNDEDRKRLPIIDEDASMDFYASYLKTSKKKVESTLRTLIQVWPKSDIAQ